MKFTKLKLEEIIKKSEEKELLLPNFQRDFVWDRKEKQKDLLASFVFNIPIGSLLILNGESEYFATKELGKFDSYDGNFKETTMYLLDGQQRISTLKSIFFDFFKDINNWKTNFLSLYNGLRTRWFLKVCYDDEKDLFGYKKLKFEENLITNNYSPDEIKSFIEYEILYPNKSEEWFHPEYKKEKWLLNGKVKENGYIKIISEKAAEKKLIPLYGIIGNEKSKSKTLQYKVLEKIADKRIEYLKAEVADRIIDIKDILTLDSEDEETIEEAWSELKSDWVNEVYQFLDNFKKREIPIIELSKEEMNRAIYTFETVNKGGVSLSTYDLIVAKAAYIKNEKSLTEKIKELLEKKIKISEALYSLENNEQEYLWNPLNMGLLKDDSIIDLVKNQYLNLLTIFSNTKYEEEVENIKLDYIKKNEQLKLNSDQINDNTEITIKSLIRAYAFIQFKCGIVKLENLSYKLMILPIAYILRDDNNWNDKKVINKIEYWYWSSLFGGSYRQEQNRRVIDDIKNLYKYIKTGENNFTDREKKILNVEEYSDYETLTLKNKDVKSITAIENGILQYILSKGPRDFINDDIYLKAWEIAEEKEYFFNISNKNKKIEIQAHHICPLGNATRLGQSTKELRKKKNHILNSALNKTYISEEANALISDKSPNQYFEYVSNIAKYGHCIPTPIIDKFKKKDKENDDEYYERIVKQRYDELKKDLEVELDKLKNK